MKDRLSKMVVGPAGVENIARHANGTRHSPGENGDFQAEGMKNGGFPAMRLNGTSQG